MVQLRNEAAALAALQAEVVVIGPDEAHSFRQFWLEHRIPFTGIPDPSGAILESLGQESHWWQFGRMPFALIVDKRGKVRWVHRGSTMWDLPDIAPMKTALKALAGEGDGTLSDRDSNVRR